MLELQAGLGVSGCAFIGGYDVVWVVGGAVTVPSCVGWGGGGGVLSMWLVLGGYFFQVALVVEETL